MHGARADCWRVRAYWRHAMAMGIIVNAIPKSGTHLLAKLLQLLGLGRDGSVYLAPRSGDITAPVFGDDGLLCYGGDAVSLSAARYATTTRARFVEMADTIAGAGDDAYFEAHQLWSQAGADILAARGIKQVIIMRDPRGVALSHAEWMVDPNGHNLRELVLGTTLRERLTLEFFGLPANTDARFDPLVPILTRYRNMAPWAEYPLLQVTTFEALSGGEGEAAQRSQIEAIAAFAGIAQFDMARVQRELWGDSPTFRHGVADRWRDHLDDFPAGVSDQVEEMLAIVARMRARAAVQA